jgi:CDGSH-type Zn-finger protein/uncharacterized Fe-S cluster protein YjdI
MNKGPLETTLSREHMFHALSEAAELEHCLMCTYLYGVFSLRTDAEDGLNPRQLEAVKRWRRVILEIANEEMGHLISVWNIMSALGSAPHLGRANFPLDPGLLPAGLVVKLAPFDHDTLQHFIFLERPADSEEPDSSPFAPEYTFERGADSLHLTPMAVNYKTVGEFYEVMAAGIKKFVERVGEKTTFCGDPALQLDSSDTALPGISKVICLKTVLEAFAAIVSQGEGARASSEHSHYRRFESIRAEYETLLKEDPEFRPAFPAATNPVLRRPPKPQGRVWIEDALAIAICDLGNSVYGLMLRLLAHSYSVRNGNPEKASAIELAIGLMHALVPLAERAARLPAGPSNPHCNAGVSFVALRDASPLPPGISACRFFVERLTQLAEAGKQLDDGDDARVHAAASILSSLAHKAVKMFDVSASPVASPTPIQSSPVPTGSPAMQEPDRSVHDGIEEIEAEKLTLIYEGKRCIHSRHCVTWGPNVFLANVEGPWIHPEAMDAERVAEIAHICPSGAIRYRRKDGRPDESAPPVNLAAVREAGPYAFRGDLRIDGEAAGFRVTLCRCGASKNKPFCDSSHHEAKFEATGEPSTGDQTEMLAVRDGPLEISPQVNGPLQIKGNLEIASGTGRMVARVTSARLCRCGASGNKPFCDGSHAKVGFTSE